MTQALQEKVQLLARGLGIEADDVLRALDTPGRSESMEAQGRRIENFARARDNLEKLIPENDIKAWMRTPVKRLSGESPQ